MKKWPLLLVACLVMFGLVLGGGCDETNNNTPPAVENPYGGYDTGDMDMSELDGMFASEPNEAGDDAEDPDNLVNDEDVDDLFTGNTWRVHIMRIDWGQLQFNENKTSVTDWTGSIEVSDGGIRLLRKIWFEPAILGDRIVRPRTDAKVLAWVSHTSVHHDGLFLKVITPADNDDITVTLTAGAYNKTWNITELDKYDETVRMGNDGDEISVASIKRPDLVNAGVLVGRWNKGKFLGRWVNFDGSISGYLMGYYGIRKNGAKVFFGKYVDNQGKFKGLLRGIWWHAPILTKLRGGFFLGHWVDKSREFMGILGGYWAVALDPTVEGGYFKGCWIAFDAEKNPVTPSEDEDNTFPQP
jgi:hypothetical protein